MFVCGKCGLTSQLGEKENRVPIERRKKSYDVYKTFWKKSDIKNDIPAKKVTRFVRKAFGWEVVRELKMCYKCYETYCSQEKAC